MDRDNRILLRVSFRNCTFYCKTEQLLEEMKVISIKREIWTEEMINKIELPNIFREGGLLVFCKFCKYFFWTHSQVQVWCAKATFWFVTTGWIVHVNFFKIVLWPTYKLKQRHSGVQFFNISPVVFFFFFFHYNIKPIKTSWSNLNLFTLTR